MKIAFNNVDFNSNSGPNGFGLKLARAFSKMGHYIVSENPEVTFNFIQGYNVGCKNILRLDGIYFNSKQDWARLNEPIKQSYHLADHVIVQSKFDKLMIETFFGEKSKDKISVIHNGTDIDFISKMMPVNLNKDKAKVWMCASAWRPNKRLDDNVKLFQQYADKDSVLLVAGSDIQNNLSIKDDRIKIMGNLRWEEMIAFMKSSGHFIHLAYLDHCPNVVIDAKAAGCIIHAADSGGTKELLNENDFIYHESESYNFNIIDLFDLPKFTQYPDGLYNRVCGYSNNIDMSIDKVAKQYFEVAQKCLNIH